MHELAITESLIRVAVNAADGRRVHAIHLAIGALSSVVDDSVQFYFDFLSRDSLAAGAILHFRRIPASARCQACGHQQPVVPPLPPACPVCASVELRISGGVEFHVESIEVADDP
ncbi:MAG: hydrogenase maturation nickel metallochaperone HypA [Candidatus Viridilinea halotolerans]|uniref:Hydrogenase maturation factor HypA n=1 Tax=Candidatus Viridilinea halotolerans TaxID=2491704 RepID=A0A426TUP9_9CHLR|nr:MAG: hydrogenase maturation nickel metallochaperone HypA [Candidatus Viridilinea halotolerans]